MKARTTATQPALLIVADRRELLLGCMSSWLATFRHEFEVVSVLDVEKSLRPSEIARASAVILGAATPSLPNPWLEQQVAWLLAKRPDMPIIAITDADEADTADAFVTDLNLRGYIPTSSKIEVAAAALRLVLAGGTYLPRQREVVRSPANGPLAQILREDAAELLRTLTPRERGVLELLQRGMANKTIAYRLNMSSSTVKVHVHNIMVKLNARNRTEVAVAAARFVGSSTASGSEVATQNESGLRLAFEAPPRPLATTPDRRSSRRVDGTARPVVRAIASGSAPAAGDAARQSPTQLSAAQHER